MRTLTANEIARTDFSSWDCYSKREKDISDFRPDSKKYWRKHFEQLNKEPDSCPCCKNKDTKLIVDKSDLEPYIAYHGATKFKLWWCFFCDYVWHYAYKPYTVIDND